MILYFIPIGLWFQALVSDVKISLLQLVLMRWRKVPPTVIVRAMIEGKKAGLELYRDLLEAHYLAGDTWLKRYMPWCPHLKRIST